MNVDELAAVFREHEPDVTSYDAGDVHGCECGWTLPRELRSGWDEKWPAYRAHLAQVVLASPVLKGLLNEAWHEGRNAASRGLRNSPYVTEATAVPV